MVAMWLLLLPFCLVHVVHDNLISILVIDYIQKRRGQALLFSFEYKLLLPKLLIDFYNYMDQAFVSTA